MFNYKNFESILKKYFRNNLLNVLTLGIYKSLNNQFNNISNITLEIEALKSHHYEILKNKNKKSILFITQLTINGGIEERLYKIVELIKDKYNIFIACPNTDVSPNYARLIHPNIFIFNFPNTNNHFLLEKFFRRIIAYHNINYTCFEKGWFNNDLNFNNLKINNNKLILIYHEKQILTDSLNLSNFNYFFTVRSSSLYNIPYKNKDIFLNGVLNIEKHYQPNQSNRILIACRLDCDNLNFYLKNLVIFATKNNFLIDIAGQTSSKSNDYLQNTLNKINKNINYIGTINTIEYLKNNPNKYLFLAGVGQFTMEGISLGFPFLYINQKNKLTFIKKENFLTFYQNNFGSSTEFNENKQSLQQDLECIKNGKIESFQLLNEAKKYMLFQNHVQKFISTLESL